MGPSGSGVACTVGLTLVTVVDVDFLLAVEPGSRCVATSHAPTPVTTMAAAAPPPISARRLIVAFFSAGVVVLRTVVKSPIVVDADEKFPVVLGPAIEKFPMVLDVDGAKFPVVLGSAGMCGGLIRVASTEARPRLRCSSVTKARAEGKRSAGFLASPCSRTFSNAGERLGL